MKVARIFGHRGARGEMPENTFAGFVHAAAAGAAGIETDIAVTADFCAVLHHDPQLPDGRLIRDLKFSELPAVPALAEALARLPDIEWLLEIKTFPAEPEKSHEPAAMVRAVCAALAGAAARRAGIRVLAFDWAVLRQVRAQAPDLRLVCLTGPAPVPRDLWWGRGFGGLSVPQAVARLGASGWAPHHAGLTAAAVAQARALGLQIIPWTVNEPADFSRLAPCVDGIITDYPARFLAKTGG